MIYEAGTSRFIELYSNDHLIIFELMARGGYITRLGTKTYKNKNFLEVRYI